LQQKSVSLEQAKLDYQLFIDYDFPRQVEQLLSRDALNKKKAV